MLCVQLYVNDFSHSHDNRIITRRLGLAKIPPFVLFPKANLVYFNIP